MKMLTWYAMASAASVAVLAATPAAALVGTPAFGFDAPGAVRSTGNWSFSYNFYIYSDLKVVGLGIYSGGQIPVGNKVNLYRCDFGCPAGELIASATIDANASIIDDFAYVSIDSVLLDNNYMYQVVGTMPFGYKYTSDSLGFYSDLRVDYALNSNAYASNLDAAFEPVIFGNVDNGYWGPNLLLETAVPEPASWAMLIAGFGLTGAAMRRRHHARAAI
jgi:hypothetical protein